MYASLRPRLLAFLLDYVLIAAYIVVLSLVVALLLRGPLRQVAARLFASPLLFNLSVFLVLVLPVGLYFALSESSAAQATWGKRRMRLQVAAARGGRLSLARSALRSTLKFAPWELAHTCLFYIPGWPLAVKYVPLGATIGLILVWLIVAAYLVSLVLSKTRQTLYDRAAGSVVVVRPAGAET